MIDVSVEETPFQHPYDGIDRETVVGNEQPVGSQDVQQCCRRSHQHDEHEAIELPLPTLRPRFNVRHNMKYGRREYAYASCPSDPAPLDGRPSMADSRERGAQRENRQPDGRRPLVSIHREPGTKEGQRQ